MPAMLRTSKKNRRIAYSVLGVPANMTKTPRKYTKITNALHSEYDELLRSTPERFVRK